MGASYCDIRVEESDGLDIELKDGVLEKAVSGREKGFGIRLLADGAWGFYSSNLFSQGVLEKGLTQALAIARASAKMGAEKIELAEVRPEKGGELWKPRKNPADYSIEEKMAVLRDMDRAVRQFPEIKSVTTGYGDGTSTSRFLSSEGADVTSEVTRTVAQVNFIARKDGEITGRRARIGGTLGYEIFDIMDPVEKGVEAAKATVALLSAQHAPAGTFTLVADPDLAGVFAHEALGHAAEADLVVNGESILEGRLGQRLGSELVTIVDDPSIPGAFGSFPFDDEGLRAERKVLVEKGILKTFINDRYTAAKLDLAPNGGARAESYGVRPLVRMSNTLIQNGGLSFEELLEDIGTGIYAKGTRGGQVDTAKGSFQFAAQEAYLVEKGDITKPLKDVSLSGTILGTLLNIDGVGNDQSMGDPGFCGKGQMVPVGDGGPHIRIRDVVVGGQ
ncbi:MAG: TldD/PmbA family protein [Candidatus Anoxymicrobium japonicum]|uniref:TldD/PmbA family protein n=1 Tax=Candidatus Anoxymicrobium japonicum TaxID=2013648 RepID=A0A2N3G592_9ACTN|nr:MAG: TldD/PmbA family protein [Candidatus Anoxymicrobium japonicum]